jgi:hypothetical protein
MMPANDPQKVPVTHVDLSNAQAIWIGTNNYDGICRCNKCRSKTLGLMLDTAFNKQISRDVSAAEAKFGKNAAAHVMAEGRDKIEKACESFRRN